MADELANEVQDIAPPTRKSPMKWILIALSVVVLAGGGFVGWTVIREGQVETGQSDAEFEEKQPQIPAEPDVGQMFALDPFVVNLSDPGGKRYLKSKIELEFTEEPVRQELTARLPQLRDVILLYLSSKSMEEIQSVDGKTELRNSLIKRINQVLKSGKIRNLYFTQFVIQ
jgi:flagellar FliL protein